jgi:hemerythrin-like domain-containing protein
MGAGDRSARGDVMKITERLTADHRMFRKIIREVDGFTRKRLTKADKDRLVRLVSLLKRQLSAHAWFEDMFFYPVLREAVETGDSLPQGTLFMSVLDREHKAIEDRLGLLLAQLESETAFARWPRTFSFFFQELMAHMGKEENTLFPLAEKSLGAEVLEDLSRKADRHRSGPPRSSNK